jgi:sarcosine/dimethylglycine N-methyltransferase
VLSVRSRAPLAASPPTPGGPSLGVAMGADFPDLIRNLGRNLAEGRVGTLSAVLERAALPIEMKEA